jgi:hypothetical protein
MDITARIKEIESIVGDTPEQLENDYWHKTFESIEYYMIVHLTNEELYYTSDEEIEQYQQCADLIEDTQKGRVYGFK